MGGRSTPASNFRRIQDAGRAQHQIIVAGEDTDHVKFTGQAAMKSVVVKVPRWHNLLTNEEALPAQQLTSISR